MWTKRIHQLVRDLGPRTTRIPVSSTIDFHEGDLVRITTTGESFVVKRIEGGTLHVRRGIGTLKPRRAAKGTDIVTIGSMKEREVVE